VLHIHAECQRCGISDAAEAAEAAGHMAEVLVHLPDARIETLDELAADGSEWAADELGRIEDALIDAEDDVAA
jgi:hypothetical protein